MGLMDKPLTDPAFFTALEDARQEGLDLEFRIDELTRPDHPNSMEILLVGQDERQCRIEARSIGGGGLTYTQMSIIERALGRTSHALHSWIARPTELLLACEDGQV